jgi:hypothetical protein
MTFARPWLLLLLIVPVLLAWWEWRRRGLPLVLPLDHSGARPRRWLARTIKLASLLPVLLLAVAIGVLAGPQRVAMPKDERVLTNIEVVLDVSGSMMARFGDGNRADARSGRRGFHHVPQGRRIRTDVFGRDHPFGRRSPGPGNHPACAPFLRLENAPHMSGTHPTLQAARENSATTRRATAWYPHFRRPECRSGRGNGPR